MEKNEFFDDLRNIGIEPGDDVFLRAALTSLQTPNRRSIIDWFIEYLGDEGTLLIPAYTGTGFLFLKPYPIFDRNSVPTIGSLSKIAVGHPSGKRSDHPTHSFICFGRKTDFLLDGHDENSPSHLPINRFAELDGKMVVVGCNRECPGMSTEHAAQYDLGLSQQHFLRYFQRVNLKGPDGTLRTWTPSECPGCSCKFDRFYPGYIRTENFRTGLIAGAWTIIVRAKEAYEVDIAMLKENPRLGDCGRLDCFTCSFRGYHLSRIPLALFALGYRGLRYAFKRMAGRTT
ncbi:MAG: AAC(3) family N-acetyltransferase [Planctomycetaceae bacterium]|nr:AAC(3) family N-acetyltransferase [Planctomycetaceae bacterium]